MSTNEVEEEVTIEEALKRTGFGKYNYFVIIFAGCMFNSVYLESVGISFTLPILECDFGLTLKQQGILGAVSFIGIIVSSHLWGFLADTTGRKRILHPALISAFLITFLSSFSPNFETLVVLRFINGIFISAGSATTFAYLGEFHCLQNRNRAIMYSAMISAILAFLFPLLALCLINQSWEFQIPLIDITFKPWRSYVLACGMQGLFCSIILSFLPESPKFLMLAKKHDMTLNILRTMYRINTGGKTDFNVKTLLPDADTCSKPERTSTNKNPICALLSSMWHQTSSLFGHEHLRKTMLASLMQFIIYFSFQGILMWFPSILNSATQYSQQHSTPMTICEILKFTNSKNFSLNFESSECKMTLEMDTFEHIFMYEAVYSGLLFVIILAIKKFGRLPMLFTILFVCGTSGVVGFAIKIPLIAIYLIVLLLCCGWASTVVTAIVVDIYPTHLRAMAVCISMMMGRVGIVSGSSILGTLIESNCELTLFGAAGSVIAAAFLGFLLPRTNTKSSCSVKENC